MANVKFLSNFHGSPAINKQQLKIKKGAVEKTLV